jgi:hypothetical protein
MTNKTNDSTWPGDPDYLEDKFVRFSYRFKYDDNEYSLMAPFTQIAYIPKQYGYFLNGDEDRGISIYGCKIYGKLSTEYRFSYSITYKR